MSLVHWAIMCNNTKSQDLFKKCSMNFDKPQYKHDQRCDIIVFSCGYSCLEKKPI